MEEPGSSSGSSSKHPITKRQNFILHVLSPSADVPNKITFPDVPVSATVRELKSKICNAVDSRPSPERQRLIYRGKPIVRDTFTLKEIFTEETINRSESISLHLVLPPSTSSQTSIPSAPPRSTQLGIIQQPARWLSSATGRRDHESQDTTTRNTAVPDEPVAAPPPSQNPDLLDDSSTNLPRNMPSHLPSHIQQAMTDHFQTLFQHFAPPYPVNGNTTVPGNISNPSYNHQAQHSPDNAQPAQSRSHPDQPMQQPNFQPLSFNQIIARQQQIRAAAGLHGLGNSNYQQHMQPNNSPLPPFLAPGDISASSGSSGSDRNIRPSTPTTFDRSAQETVPSPPESATNPQIPQIKRDSLPSEHPRSGQSQESLIEENLSVIESALAASSALHESVFQSLPNQLQTLQNETDTSTETLTRLGARLKILSDRADQLRARSNNSLARVVAESAPVHGSFIPTPVTAVNSSADNTIYLLSSPSGPHALLVSPSGLYTTPWQFPTLATPNSNLNVNQTLNQFPDATVSSQPSRFPHATVSSQPSRFPHQNDGQSSHGNPSQNERTSQLSQPLPQTQPQPEQLQQQQQHPQPEQQEEVNQVRGLARALLPLGGHVWLLIRLFGFVYFFTGGGGHVRAIVLGLCAFMVFIAQTGVFHPFLQSIWEPIRRHVENILPLATNERPFIAQGANAGNNANVMQDRAAPGVEAVPTPHQTAERLLRERDRREGGIFRQNLRRLERALALFVASLVPGVGERHIAARDAAEAARREEERSREEQRLREENARTEEEDRVKRELKEQDREDEDRVKRELEEQDRLDAGVDRESVSASHERDQLATTPLD